MGVHSLEGSTVNDGNPLSVAIETWDADPLPVSGSVEVANEEGNPLPVSGAVTNVVLTDAHDDAANAIRVKFIPLMYQWKAVLYADHPAYVTGLAVEVAAGWEPHSVTNIAVAVGEDLVVTYRKVIP